MLCLQSPEAAEFVKKLWQPVLELTHNHGTENDPAFRYHNGNDAPHGFGHIGMLCNDLEKACSELEAAGVAFRKKPQVHLTIKTIWHDRVSVAVAMFEPSAFAVAIREFRWSDSDPRLCLLQFFCCSGGQDARDRIPARS